MSFVDVAYEVLSRFVGPSDVPRDVLRSILTRSFATFRDSGTFYKLHTL